jgi:GxxExxY protein
LNRLRVTSPLPDDLEEIVHDTIGSCIAVHEELGPGLLESVYAKAVASELRLRSIPSERERLVPIRYRGEVICHHRLDIFVAERLVLEIKAAERLLPIHTAQVISYLHVTGARVGLPVNFNVALLKQGIRRLVL